MRRLSKPWVVPPPVINAAMPCKNGQRYVAADGSCLRCGADQGVAGYACDAKATPISTGEAK